MSENFKKTTENENNEKALEILSHLPEFVKLYHNQIRFSTAASSRLNYLRDIELFFEYIADTEKGINHIKDITTATLDNLTSDDINTYLSYIAMYEKDGVVMTNDNVSIKRKLSSIRNLYNFLYNEDMIEHNPASKIKSPKLQKKNIVKMDDEEIKSFLETVEYGTDLTGQKRVYHNKYGKRDYTILALMLGTGIRVSECVGLNLQDVDLKHHCLKLIRKGNKEDIVYFSDELTEILREYIYIYRKKIIPVEGHEDALFYSSQRKRMGIRSIEKMVEKYTLESGMAKHITPHKLRSTFGTKLYNETGDLYLVSSTLGHSSVDTTRRHYADISDQHKEQARNTIKLT